MFVRDVHQRSRCSSVAEEPPEVGHWGEKQQKLGNGPAITVRLIQLRRKMPVSAGALPMGCRLPGFTAERHSFDSENSSSSYSSWKPIFIDVSAAASDAAPAASISFLHRSSDLSCVIEANAGASDTAPAVSR